MTEQAQTDSEAPRPRPTPKPVLPANSGAGDSTAKVREFVDRRPVHVAFSTMLMFLGGALGFLGGQYYAAAVKISPVTEPASYWFNVVAITILGILVAFLIAASLFRRLISFIPRLEKMSLEDKLAGIFGLVLGLIVAVLLQPLVRQIPAVGILLVMLTYFFAVFFGILFGVSMKKELVRMFANPNMAEEASGPVGSSRALPKLLDTNVVIDGRILDVFQAGFVEGELIVPQFVLDELQAIADSADELKRARGRRGLDLLNRLKGEVEHFRVLRPRDYPVPVNDAEGVDGKLVRLASAMGAALLTNDFNLSKVAELQSISVLNVNKLALALKPVVMAGEELRVNIIRHGRDPGQGVAYLDDGTMVVVEEADQKVGRVVDVVVSSMLQTVAGKMIFATLKDNGSEHGRPGSYR